MEARCLNTNGYISAWSNSTLEYARAREGTIAVERCGDGASRCCVEVVAEYVSVFTVVAGGLVRVDGSGVCVLS